jgi:hypothetical protein
VAGHRIDGRETAGQLAREDSLHPLTGPQSALGISAKVARGVIRGWTSRKHEYGQSIHGQRQAKGFLKRPLLKQLENDSTVTVRHWQYQDSGTWAIISWYQLSLPTSQSARYCTSFKVWGCQMLKQRVAQKLRNTQRCKGCWGAHPNGLSSTLVRKHPNVNGFPFNFSL